MLSEWVKEALKSAGMSGAELARQMTARLGRSIDRAAVQKMQAGSRRVSADEMLVISDITGHPAPVEQAGLQVQHVPLVSMVSAGPFAATGEVSGVDDLPTIEAVGLPAGEWIALRVEGDSMDRISPPGSIIFVNRKERRLVLNALYVIALEDGSATYKRYRSNPDRFQPVSNNQSLEDIFPDGQVRIIGRVRRTMLEM